MKLTTGTWASSFWILKSCWCLQLGNLASGGIPVPTSDLSFGILHQHYVDIFRVWVSSWEVFRNTLWPVILWLREWNFLCWPPVFELQILTQRSSWSIQSQVFIAYLEWDWIAFVGKGRMEMWSSLTSFCHCGSVSEQVSQENVLVFLYFSTRTYVKYIYLYP